MINQFQSFDEIGKNGGDVTPQDYVDAVNNHVTVSYSFAGQILAQIVGDPEQYIVIKYPNNTSEAGYDLATRYVKLVNADYAMQVLGPLFGGDDNGGGKDQTPTPTNPTYEPKFYKNGYPSDGTNFYIGYSFADQNGMTSTVQAGKISLVVYTK